ncbi:AraC family transcriptional regulator [Jiangella aurantiaca]|uniref:AraC family transcriptional regulator n=1 Tax=Jiangella aurantiaca TaxID=2530373 RepID=A0A4R5AII7_9ACTN|nr:AraC family transcriptional regulator [Jiangella aurantiaca]TDD72341.1 AraC family transcriptional regulator [Jiangella aurantiaca]
MDALSELLDGVRARGALIGRTVLAPRWSVRFATGAELTLLAVIDGTAWLLPPDGDPVRVGAGDVAVVRGPEPFTVAVDPAARPEDAIKLADYCAWSVRAGAAGRTCDPGADGDTVLLTGTYDGAAGISERLLDALPRILVIAEADCPCPMLDVVADEIAADRPGQQVVLDRLLDLMLVSTLRGWFDRPQARAPHWYGRLGDSPVSRALRLLHDDPGRAWTVGSLAAAARVSRALLAREFTAQVGEPPMSYLTGWRLSMAADLLRETDATIESIARRVGYGSAFALSAAFKRRRGLTPSQHRTVSRPARRRTATAADRRMSPAG